MITADIIHAIQTEIKYYLDGVGSYVLDTNLANDISFALPLIVIEIKQAPDSARLPGNGITRIDYDIVFRVYNFEPGAYNDEDGGYSASLMDFIDATRQYLCNEVWQTNEMKAITDNYGFRMEFQGIQDAEPLEGEETLYLGQKLTFASIAFDQTTNSTYDMLDQSGTITGNVVFNDLSL
jgi:hypothetical protein